MNVTVCIQRLPMMHAVGTDALWCDVQRHTLRSFSRSQQNQMPSHRRCALPPMVFLGQTRYGLQSNSFMLWGSSVSPDVQSLRNSDTLRRYMTICGRRPSISLGSTCRVL